MVQNTPPTQDPESFTLKDSLEKETQTFPRELATAGRTLAASGSTFLATNGVQPTFMFSHIFGDVNLMVAKPSSQDTK